MLIMNVYNLSNPYRGFLRYGTTPKSSIHSGTVHYKQAILEIPHLWVFGKTHHCSTHVVNLRLAGLAHTEMSPVLNE